MISLTYLSSAVRLWNGEMLSQLLHQAREANARAGITGVLLYSGGNFIQTLEGPECAVDATMARVVEDPRHTGVLVVCREQVLDRSFAGWSMGFTELPPEAVEEIPGFTDYLRTGQVAGATTGRHAAAVFHRAFRTHVRDLPEWHPARTTPH